MVLPAFSCMGSLRHSELGARSKTNTRNNYILVAFQDILKHFKFQNYFTFSKFLSLLFAFQGWVQTTLLKCNYVEIGTKSGEIIANVYSKASTLYTNFDIWKNEMKIHFVFEF